MGRYPRHRYRVLRSHEKGHGRGLPFRPGSAAYRSRARANADAELQSGDRNGGSQDGFFEVYEWFAAEYGWTARFIESNVTDEQFALYAEAAAKRRKAQSFAELDRIVTGTSWGVGLAFDSKGRTARKWQSIRGKANRQAGHSESLSGAALERAVMALAAVDSSLVKIQSGAS